MTVSPSAKRAVIKGAIANVIDEHRDAVDLVTRLADAVTETLAEVDAAEACPVHSPTGSPCDCGHPGADDRHPKESR